MERPRVLLELEPMTGKRWPVDPVLRLRQAIKTLGRRFGWRCVGVRSVPDLAGLEAGEAPEGEGTEVRR